jgi:hypothetical protein
MYVSWFFCQSVDLSPLSPDSAPNPPFPLSPRLPFCISRDDSFYMSDIATSILEWLQTRGIADDTDDAKFILSQLLTAGFLAPATGSGATKSARYTWGPRRPESESDDVRF